MAGQKGAGIKRSFSAVFPQKEVSPPPVKRKVEVTTPKAAVADFFKPRSQQKPTTQNVSWRIIDNSCLVGRYLTKPAIENDMGTPAPLKKRVAAFDFDHTLIATKTGNRFPRNENDWKWWDERVPQKLRKLYAEGYQIVIVTNQKKVLLKKVSKGGLADAKSLTIFKTKAADVMKSLGIPLSLYAATEYDEYRKPRTRMWKTILDDYDLDVEGALDLKGSIFVGDAAGRPGDHSCVDRNFAENIGLRFNTPEEFFRGEAPQPVERFNPKSFLENGTSAESSPPFTKAQGQELVIFCGSPGSGKSTYYWRYLQPLGYERVNQDILKSRPKCLKVADDYLAAEKSVAVDNTNADPETRVYWVKLAKEHNVPIRCIYLSTPQSICKHNSAVRAANPKLESINPENRTFLPEVAFGDFSRRFQEPQVDEGFEEIIRVAFQFDGDPTAREVWVQHWN